MSVSIIFRVLYIICILPSYSYAQDYLFQVQFPLVAYDVNFTDKSSTNYIQLKQDVTEGLENVGRESNITDIDLWVPGDSYKWCKFALPYNATSVSRFLFGFINEGFEVKKQKVYPTNIQYTDGADDKPILKTVPTDKVQSPCDIRRTIKPCEKNYVCKDGGCVSSNVDVVTETEAEKEEDTGRFVALGYGGAFVVFLLVFLLVYCYKKGCANRRKQIKNEQADNNRRRVDSEENVLPSHIYSKSRR